MKYFIDEEFLKNKTQVTQNVDASDLSPYIAMASRMYLPPILGHNFYIEILDKYNNDTLNGDETELVEFIKYVVGFWTVYEAAPNLTYRLGSKGLQAQSGEFSSEVGIQILDRMQRQYQKMAEDRSNELRAYLLENKDKFEGYTKDNDDITKPDGQRNGGSSIRSL